jgi:hypothetical protein
MGGEEEAEEIRAKEDAARALQKSPVVEEEVELTAVELRMTEPEWAGFAPLQEGYSLQVGGWAVRLPLPLPPLVTCPFLPFVLFFLLPHLPSANQIGDKVRVIKSGHYYGLEGLILDPHWSGRVKVECLGHTYPERRGERLSYMPYELWLSDGSAGLHTGSFLDLSSDSQLQRGEAAAERTPTEGE